MSTSREKENHSPGKFVYISQKWQQEFVRPKKEVGAFMAFLENGETIDEVKKAEKERRFQSK